MYDDVQIARLQHALQFTCPQTLRVLALAQLLQGCDLVPITLHHNRADIEGPVRVGIFQASLDRASLNLGEYRVARANVDRGKLRAGRCVEAFWIGMRWSLDICSCCGSHGGLRIRQKSGVVLQ